LAFESLYERHAPRMKSIARNLMGNTADAEDAVQEAFLKIYRNASTFRGGAPIRSGLAASHPKESGGTWLDSVHCSSRWNAFMSFDVS
jgi:Sigma-70 region 2